LTEPAEVPHVAETCPYCSAQLRIRYHDLEGGRDYHGDCPKCYAVFETSIYKPFDRPLEPETRYACGHEPYDCFLCHKPIAEEDEVVMYPLDYPPFDSKAWYEAWYVAHERCDEYVAKPFFDKLYRAYLSDEEYDEADVKAFAMLEQAFVKILFELNVNKTPIRKIAAQTKINRGKVWRIAKHIAELQNA
jgi:hypothetical protein